MVGKSYAGAGGKPCDQAEKKDECVTTVSMCSLYIYVTGGVSGALKRVGGDELQRTCTQYVQRNGPLKVCVCSRCVSTIVCTNQI